MPTDTMDAIRFYSDLSVTSYVLSVALAYFVVARILWFLRSRSYPKDIPWVGGKNGWLPSFRGMKEQHREGYELYGKQNEAYIVPGVLGNPPEVIMPRSQMAWMLDQPDHVLSTGAAHYDALIGEYNFLTNILLKDVFHEHVLHRSLPRQLNGLIPGIQDELIRSIDDALGTDEDNWKTVKVWDTLLELIPYVTNRIFVGSPLCRNEDYISNMKAITNDIVRNMLILNTLPKVLMPVLGPIAALANQYHFRKTAKHSLPFITQRLQDITRKNDGDPEYQDWSPPNDYVTWHIQLAISEGRIEELEPIRIAQRLVPINFASIHTTTMTAFNVMLDILSAGSSRGGNNSGRDYETQVIASLREETTRVWKEEGGQWSKVGLSKLHRMDSAIRESIRVNPFAQTILQRKVVAQHGITNATTGQHFQCGTTLSCPIWGIQHDQEYFGVEADSFDAFRFSRDREAFDSRPKTEQAVDEGLQLKKTGLVTTSNLYLGFGHGRHAWYVSQLYS